MMKTTPKRFVAHIFITLSSQFFINSALADTNISGAASIIRKGTAETHKSIGTVGIRAVDVFLNKAGLRAAIKKVGLSGNSASQVERVARLAIKNLAGTENPSRQAFLRELSLINSGVDARVKNKMLLIFRKSEKDMTPDDFVNAINSLVYLAGRHGVDNSLALACSACVSDVLSNKGFLFSYEQVTDKTTSFILKNVIPSNPTKLNQFIKNRMSRLGHKSSARMSRLLNSSNEKSFALFLSIPEHGTPAQKELFKAIEEFSKKADGSVEFFDQENYHTFWRLYTTDLNEAELLGWSKILKEASQEASEKGEKSKQAAFYRYFERKVAEDPSLAPHLDTLKKKNCYFK